MKNKKTTYILIPVVIIIWGFLIFKIIDAFADEPADDLPVKNYDREEAYLDFENNNIDYSLLAIDRDPFLGHSYIPKAKVKKQPVKLVKTEWPKIIFKGGVTSINNSSKIFILNINGRENLAKIGQKVEGIKLLKHRDDKIYLRYKGENRAFESE